MLQGCFLSPQQKFYKKISKLKEQPLPIFQNMTLENYRIQQGDNFADIAKKKNLRIDTLISANPHIKKHHNVAPKTIIKIPNIDGIFHNVKKTNETKSEKAISQLSKKYNICHNQITFYNLENGKSNLFIPHAFYSFESRNDLFGYPFLAPLKHFRISSHFGFRIHPIKKTRRKHKGIDLAAPGGTTVYASKSGVVLSATHSPSYGKIIIIKHSKGFITYYAHLQRILVKKNARVATGQPIGKVGNTGVSTGNHLHFEIRRNNIAIDPRNLTDFKKKKKI